MTAAQWAADISDIGDAAWSANVLIYGPPGCGKTALASALPDSLLIAFDPGYATAKALRRKCKVRTVNDERELMAGIEYLEDGGQDQFRWIIADGWTILQQKMTLANARDEWTANNAKRASAYQPDKPDYGKQQNAIKSAIARLCDLQTNVLFTAHATLQDEDGNNWIRPQFEGREYKIGNYVNGLMSSVGYMALREKEVGTGKNKTLQQVRRVLWEQRYDSDKDLTYMAKDQLGVFGEVMDDPTGEQIHDLVMSIGA